MHGQELCFLRNLGPILATISNFRLRGCIVNLGLLPHCLAYIFGYDEGGPKNLNLSSES